MGKPEGDGSTLGGLLINWAMSRPEYKDITSLYPEPLTAVIASLLDCLPEPVAIIDSDYRIILMNRAGMEFSGLKIEAGYMPSCYEVFHCSDMPCKKRGEPACPLDEVLKTGNELRLRHWHTSRNGISKLLEISASPLKDYKGSVLGMIEVFRDITQEVKTNEMLKQSEARNRMFIKSIPDMIFVLDKDGVFLDFVPALKEATYLTPEQFLGRKITDIMPADVAQTTMVNIAKVLKSRDPSTFEYMLDMHGMACHYEARLVLLDEKSVLGIIRNITDRKLTEHKLLRSERLLSETQKVAKIGSWEWDIKNNKIHWTDELYRIFGLDPALFHATYEAFLGVVHPGDREMLDALVKESVATGRPYRVDARILKPDGSMWVMDARGEVIKDSDGVPIMMQGTAQDITERKLAENAVFESEEMFRSLAEKSPNMIFINQSGSIVFANDKCTEVMGYSNEEFLSDGFDFMRLVDPKDHRLVLDRLNRHVSEEEVQPYEYTLLTKDGRRLEVIISTKLVRFKSMPSILGIITDITTQKALETELRHALVDRETLIKESHHRVKNNLAIIASLLSLQSRYVSDKGSIEAFEDSQSRVRAMSLIHEKLYRSTGLVDIDSKDYFQSLFNQIYRSLRTNMNIRLEIDIDSVMLDIDFLIPCGLIVNELMTNCLKHAFKNKSEGTITAAFKKTSYNSFALIVGDNGSGLPADIETLKKKSLGLQLVDTLVHQLKGTLDVKSGGDGAEFSIRISAKEDA